MEMNIVQIKDVFLAYHRTGRGAPLVLVHGYPLDHSIWMDCIPLLEKDFDLILPDLRGFGRSVTAVAKYTLTDMADDLASLVDHLGMEKAFFAGHSMGGYISLAFAAKYPDRVSGLALVASQAAADSAEGRERRNKTAVEIRQKGVSVAAEAMPEKLSASKAIQDFTRNLILQQDPLALVGALEAMAERAETLSVLPSFDFQIVLIHGDADLLIPLDRAREIKAAVPSSILVELPGSGHMPIMESPQQTAEGLKQFLT